MALIKLTDVSVDKSENNALENGYLYKDLLLDLETSVYYNDQLNKTTTLSSTKKSKVKKTLSKTVDHKRLHKPAPNLSQTNFKELELIRSFEFLDIIMIFFSILFFS